MKVQFKEIDEDRIAIIWEGEEFIFNKDTPLKKAIEHIRKIKAQRMN